MTSPYKIRSRAQVSSPNNNNQLFKSYEATPRPTSRRANNTQTNKCSNIAVVKCSEEATAKTSKMKVQTVKRFLSHPELSLVDVHSNSFNQSSLIAEKYRRSDADFQKTEQNLNSIQNEQSVGFALNSSERQLQPNLQKNQSSPAPKQKKRDRTQKNWSCYGVPYRKCHSSMEQKVVSIINKIKNGKDCHKQIQTLVQKTKRVSIKQLNNRFFVSGIQLLCKLATEKEYSKIFNYDLVLKLDEALRDLKTRIMSQLDNIKGFEIKQPAMIQEIAFQKLELVRRAYKILRKKMRSLKREEVQDKALQAADWFIDNKVNDICLFYDQLAQC